MESVVIDYYNTHQNSSFLALAHRIGYVFTSRVILTGYYGDAYCFYNAKNNPSDHVKWRMVQLAAGADDKQKMVEMEILMKTLKQVKHKRRDQIMMLKKLDKDLTAFFDKGRKEMSKPFYEKGFMQLDDSMISQHFFGFPALNSKSPEDMGPDPHSTRVSDIFTFSNGPQRQNVNYIIFLLSADFMRHPMVKDIKVPLATDAVAGDINTYLQPVFSLPDILSFSTLELQVLRKDMAPAGADLGGVMDEWCTMFEDVESANVAKWEYFTNHVIPAAAPVQQAIDQNELLRQTGPLAAANNRIQILIGELPVSLVWEYYREMKVIPPQTWEVLQKAAEHDERLRKSYPVMVVHCPQLHDADELEISAGDVLTTKKSILID